jgi:sec-independent protein translocase protein TatA
MMPSGFEWLIVLGIVVLLFGSSKLPSLARSLGSAQREFRKGAQEADDELPPAPEGQKPTS